MRKVREALDKAPEIVRKVYEDIPETDILVSLDVFFTLYSIACAIPLQTGNGQKEFMQAVIEESEKAISSVMGSEWLDKEIG